MSSSTSSECGHVMRNSTPSGVQCTPVVMLASDGKKRKAQAADLEGIFRIIQSIPSKKAEPVRQWLAELGSRSVVSPERASDYIKPIEGHDGEALPSSDED